MIIGGSKRGAVVTWCQHRPHSWCAPGRDRFRLIGIGVSDLTDAGRADPPDLVDPAAARRAVAESAIDKVRQKFGRDIVETGYTFGTSRKTRQADEDQG